jgi:hypothetical protein
MSTLEQNDHDYFEELCALAALGQISEREFVDLQAHLEVCPSCGFELEDYINLTHHKLPLVIDADRQRRMPQAGRLRSLASRGRRLEKQFRARADQNGLRFSDSVDRSPSFRNRFLALKRSFSFKLAIAPILVLLIASVAILAYRLHLSNSHNATLAGRISELSEDNAAIQQRFDEMAKVYNPVAADRPTFKSEPPGESSAAADLLAGELTRVRDENATALARIQTLESQLQAASAETQSLREQVETGETVGGQLETKLRVAETSLGQMNEEIQRLRSVRLGDSDQIAQAEARAKELSQRLKAQTEALDREKSLLAAGRDIRELMGARNLHILDVFDVDGKGKSNRTFGRVFYTEGKSLIFYAFDLGHKNGSLAKASFQAWGYHASNERSFESLGIFYVDDKTQNRWVLKFDDPEVLAQIDSVFVTIEPSGGSPRPTGQKLLYAYLNNRPNHP